MPKAPCDRHNREILIALEATGHMQAHTSRDAAMAAFALLAVAVFVLVCASVQVIRNDLDPINAPLSFYLTGGFGAAVRLAYYVLSAGLIALAWAAFRATVTHRRSAAPALLFIAAGIALVPVAATAPFAVDGAPHADFARFVHGVAAQATFLCVTVAMLLQSWHWWSDPSFSRCRGLRMVLAAAAFAALWVNALMRYWPRGLTQKVLIVLILAWLGWASWQAFRVLRRND